jgi:hypothetical protein
VPRPVQAGHSGGRADGGARPDHHGEGAGELARDQRGPQQQRGDQDVAHGVQGDDGRERHDREQGEVEDAQAIPHRASHPAVEGGEGELLPGDRDEGHGERGHRRGEGHVHGPGAKDRAEQQVLEPRSARVAEGDQHHREAEERREQDPHGGVGREAPVARHDGRQPYGEGGGAESAHPDRPAREQRDHGAEDQDVRERLAQERESAHDHEAAERAARRAHEDGLGERAAHQLRRPWVREPVHA